MAMTDWTIVLRSLRARMFSTVTTMLTVAVAVGLLLVLLMMRRSASDAFRRGSGDMHLLISNDASPLVSVLNGVFYANPPRRPIEYARFLALKQSLPLGTNGYAIPTQHGDSFHGFPVLATTREFFERFRPNAGDPWRFARGRAFDKPFEVVVGARAARETGLAIGDKLHLTHGTPRGTPGEPAPHEHEEFTDTVVGILAPSGGSHDRALFTDLTSAWIMHAHDRRERENPGAAIETTANDLTDADRRVTGVYVRLATREGSDAPSNLPQVFDQLRRDPTLTVASPRQEVDKLFAIVSNIDQIFLGMAVVVMVSSGIGIMLALYNSMEQRRRQIAVLRVLGASRTRVFGLVLTESAVIGIAGAAGGLVLAFGGAWVVARVMRDRLGLVIEPTLPAQSLAAVVLAAVALAVAAGLVPAVMAYRTSVANNLRPLG